MLLNTSSAAQAQLPTLTDLLNSIIVLNGQVADHTNSIATLNVDLNVLNSQTTTNTNAIALLNYDYNVVTGQIAATATSIAGIDGRLTTVEGILAPVAVRTTALENAVAGQATALAANAAATASNTTSIAANTSALVGAAVRLDNHDALIAANANVGVQNSTAIAANASAIVDVNARVDAHDVVIAQNTAAINVNADAIVDVNARVDAHDVAIAQNTAAINVNANAIVGVSARVDAHDVAIAQNTVNIANATTIAINAQNSSTTLRNQIVAGQIGLVQQQTATAPITVGAQTGGTEVAMAGTQGNRRITGVADGIGPSDAATVGQVAQSQAQAVTIANDYTDRSIANIVARYDDRTNSLIAANNTILRRDINAAAASTAAISSLPHSIMPGEGMGAIGIGGRGDSVAFAIGVSKAFKVDHTPVFRAGAALDAHTGTLSYNAAVGVHF